MRRSIVNLMAAALAAVTLFIPGVAEAGPLPTGFTVAPPSGMVATAVTVTATWDSACPLIDSRLFLLPPVGDDTPISENGTAAIGDTQVLLDITVGNIATPGTYRLRMTCGNPAADGAEFFVDFPVVVPVEPEPDPAAAEAVEAEPTFTG